jgi:hypothetical protein
MQSSDASFPLTSATVSLAFGLPRVRALVLCASSVRTRTHDASGTDHRLPAPPDSFEGKRGSPRLLGHPHHTRREPNTTPDALRSRRDDRDAVAFGAYGTLGIRDMFYFRGHHAAAHVLACLRIAGAVAGHRRKAGFRVIRLDLLGRKLASAGRQFRNFGAYRMLLLLDRHCLVAP